jgi:tripartite-type tricarboxylate transporter receptor subunit TctC
MRNFSKNLFFLVSLSVVLIISGCGSKAQTTTQTGTPAPLKYPEKEITLIVPVAPGGSTDVNARATAKLMSKYLNKPVVVENQDGAGGVTATTELARKKPDGYTLEFAADGLFTTQPVLQKNLGYKQDDFDFLIGTTAASPTLSVNAKSPYKTLEDLIKDAKEKGKTINYGHAGVGTSLHLAGQSLFELAGVKAQQIPFKGGGPAVTALLGEKVDVVITPEVTIMPQVQAGNARVLAVSSAKRSTLMPDVPTMKEKGYDVDISSRYYIFGPKGIPQEVKKVLDDAFQKMVADPEFKKSMDDLGIMVDVKTGKEMEEYFNKTRPIYEKLLNSAPAPKN